MPRVSSLKHSDSKLSKVTKDTSKKLFKNKLKLLKRKNKFDISKRCPLTGSMNSPPIIPLLCSLLETTASALKATQMQRNQLQVQYQSQCNLSNLLLKTLLVQNQYIKELKKENDQFQQSLVTNQEILSNKKYTPFSPSFFLRSQHDPN
tara:strand:- start:94 stop:540 length:447 start_codon:yes stop_codon:yes gene_type:complete